jgi:glycerophosphoryl diester phosphodiesterase
MIELAKVIGHRGVCHYAPENTLASLRKAFELGLSWVEFDVMLTRDGEAIIMHDDSLNRTTNGYGKVAETTYDEIEKLDAGSWFSEEFKGEKVPTFVEFLKCAAELNLGINVEIKPTSGKDLETAYKVVEILNHHFNSEKLLISSFSVASLALARALNEELHLALLLDRWFEGWQGIVKQLNCMSVNVDYRILTSDNVARMKEAGQQYVLAYVVNDLNLAETLYSWGVDAVFSDMSLTGDDL